MYSTTALVFLLVVPFIADAEKDVWLDVKCEEKFVPENCDLTKIKLLTVEDIERCGPAKLPLAARNYYLGWAGRGVTYRENREAFSRIFEKPKMLRDVSKNSLEITTLDQKVSFPVGIAPSALHKLANPEGEKATAAAAAALDTIMILSCYATTRLEDVAEKVKGTGANLWLQIYTFKNRQFTIDLVRRAEESGFKAIVLTVDSYVFPDIFCDAKHSPAIADMQLANAPVKFSQFEPALMTFDDIKWLKTITKLPIVAKGILTGDDAAKAILAGASAIIVSNHGGRQLDGLPASIDALPAVVKAVKNYHPRRDVYMDGGIRNGFDVYKAIARGAKMVFIGRPALWGLALEGERGVKRVLHILKSEFNTTMLMTGHANPSQINGQSIIPSIDNYN